ncbi:histidine kinase N-terminal 7TM domain-containing protein [Paenibacillus gorillae]|uniref:histidine kinase N-terminal 7TM domain-containing diguanylate cyclase n=1 Tax=Paenibacillus gorillae TaxID=1243662 RepID=UPI0004B703F4|nr:histidine kinase N-terminal 7TM domain-containing protein [Paenibacillus gorillae]
MGTPYSAVITLIVTAGVINVIMGIYVLTNRSKQAMSKTFIALSLFSAIYVFGTALELSAESLEEIKLWIKVEYWGLPFLPPISLLLIMHFLGMERFLKPSLRIGLFVMPVVTLLLVMTNDFHHFYYRSVEISRTASFLKVDLVAGPWYIIQGGYTFGCMFGGVLLLLLYWNRMKSSYRLQHITMLVGLLLPIAGDFAYLGNLTPEGIDPIPVIMTITSAMYMYALAGKGLMNVAPIARDNLFESMGDGVLVLDMENRLVDYNPAAASVITRLTANSIGHSIEPLWRMHTEALLIDPREREQENSAHDTSAIQEEEVLWRIGGQSYYYQIRSSIVRKKGGQENGKLIVLIDVTERVQLQEKLRDLAYHDGLTGVYNRSHFIQLSVKLLDEAVSANEPLGFLLFDIDHFKRINDGYGHDVGDQALLHVVTLCHSLLRPNDIFARYGGEEFVIAMPGLSLHEAAAAAQHLRAEIAGQPLRLPAMRQSQPELPPVISITASFGVAVATSISLDTHGGSVATVSQTLSAADRALYEAKNGGRNTVRTASSDDLADFTSHTAAGTSA